VDSISERQEQLDKEEAVRIVGQAQAAAKSVDEIEAERQRRMEGLK
jgi:lysine/ornithine N-monooxygenase